MSEPYYIITRIIDFLQGNVKARREDIVNLAKLYAHETVRINARLMRASEYLRMGRVNELVHLVEVEPNLLQRATELDFPMVNQWVDYCNNNSLEMPARIDMEKAAEISSACNDFIQVQELYRRNTLLAIGNFPLEKRIANLRTILQQSPGNPAIIENIVALEEQWVKDSFEAAKQAEKRNDFDAIIRIAAEPEKAEFINPKTEKTVEAILKIRRRMQADRGHELLDKLLPQMEEEAAANDEPACRQLKQRWNYILNEYRITPASPQLHRAGPMFNFLARIDEVVTAEHRFTQAMHDLDAMIADENADFASLRKQYRALTDMGRAIPQELQERYSRRIDALKIQARRKRRMRIAAAVVVLCVLFAGAFYLVQKHNQNRDIEKLSQDVITSIENKDVESAQKTLDAFIAGSPSLAGRPEIADLKQKCNDAVDEAGMAQAEFERLMKKVAEAGYDNLDTASLEAAEKMAYTQAARLELAKVKDAIARAQAVATQKAEKDFSAKLSEISSTLAEIDPALLDSDFDGFKAKISLLDRETSQLDSMRLVSADLKETLGPVKSTLSNYRRSIELVEKTRQDEIAAARHRRERAEKLKQAAVSLQLAAKSDIDDYIDRLGKFTAEYPESPMTKDFSKAFEQAGRWQAVHAWQQLAGGFSGDLGLATETVRRQRIAAVAKYLADYPGSPMTATAEGYLACLKKADTALSKASPWRSEMPGIMQSPSMQMDSLTTPDGQTWYMPLNSTLAESSVGLTIEAITTLDFNKIEKKLLRKISIEKLPAKPGPSPQTVLSGKVRDMLVKYDENDWNTQPLIVLGMINTDKPLDPILKANLMEVVIEAAKKVCWPESAELEKSANRLSVLSMSQVAWPDPESKSVEQSRQRAEKALAELPDFKKLAVDAAGTVGRLREKIFEKLIPCGMIWREDNEKPTLIVRASRNCMLAVVLPEENRIEYIAEVKNGKINIIPGAMPSTAGILVFKTAAKGTSDETK